jgi:hypothetical protein
MEEKKTEEQEIKQFAVELAAKVVAKEKQELKQAINSNLKKEIDEKDWDFIHFVWPIALLLPSAFWLWPNIPERWLPTANIIVILAGIIVFIAMWMKLRVIIRDMNTDKVIGNGAGKPIASTRESIEIKVGFESNQNSSKPLTKSFSGGSMKSEKVQYRHEGKIKEDKVDAMLGPSVTNWGGSESSGSGSGSNRGMQKKAPKR